MWLLQMRIASLIMWILLQFCLTWDFGEALFYSGKPFFSTNKRDSNTIHLDLTEDEPPPPPSSGHFFGSPEYIHTPPPKIYPLTPEETHQLYSKLGRQHRKSPRFHNFIPAASTSIEGGGGGYKFDYNFNKALNVGCCGGKWAGFGEQFQLRQQQLQLQQQQLQQQQLQQHQFQQPQQLQQYSYPSIVANNNQLSFDNNIKPVMEHIEGDIKYDFKTNTHSY